MPGHIAQDIAQRSRVLFLNQRARNHGHALRNIAERLRVLARLDVRRFVERLPAHHDLGTVAARSSSVSGVGLDGWGLGRLRLSVSGENHRIRASAAAVAEVRMKACDESERMRSSLQSGAPAALISWVSSCGTS